MKSSHKAIQNRIDAITPKRMGSFSNDDLTEEEIRDNLVKKSKLITEKLLTYPKKSKERKILGKELAEVNLEINAIRPRRKCPGVATFFIEIFKETYGVAQYNILMNRAVDRMNGVQKQIIFESNNIQETKGEK